MLRKIVSGGQTGADRAGLDAALELGLELGGWCPKGRGVLFRIALSRGFGCDRCPYKIKFVPKGGAR